MFKNKILLVTGGTGHLNAIVDRFLSTDISESGFSVVMKTG